jgi:hypothetical protein
VASQTEPLSYPLDGRSRTVIVPPYGLLAKNSRLHSLTVVSVIADFPNNHSRSGYGMKRHYLQEFTWNGHVSLTLRRESKKKLSVPTPVGVTPPFRGIGITPRGS